MKKDEKNIYQRGEYSFQVKMMLAGSSVNEQFDTLPEARAFRDLKSVCRTIDPDAKKIFASRDKKADVRSLTLAKVLKRYEEEILPNKGQSTQDIEAVYLSRMGKAPIASQSIFHITPDDVKTFIRGLTKCMENKNKGQPMADTSKHHYAGLLRHVFNTAIKKWGHQVTNPVVMNDLPARGKSRRRRLEGDEDTGLIEQIRVSRNRRLLPFAIMAIETGSRRGELFKLDWKNVKLQSDFGSALLVDTKNGEDRMIPLSADCVAILSTLYRPNITGPVFPMKSVRSAWDGACKRAGITDFHVHDLRHESISRLFELGLNVIEVASVSGHKTLSVLQDYTHLHPQKLARKINRAKLAA